MAQLAEVGGRVTLEEAKRNSMCNVTITDDDGEVVTYLLPYAGLRVKDGDVIEKGFALNDGALYPQDVLRVRGIHAVYDYLIQEVQKPLPPAGRGHQRQAHRGHLPPDDAQGAGGGCRRFPAALRLHHRSHRV